jgi:hypothetical protein
MQNFLQKQLIWSIIPYYHLKSTFQD